MNIPPHLEPLRSSLLMGKCAMCGEVTDLQAFIGTDTPEWLCWKDRGDPELHLHKRCEGCGAWFVGTVSAKRCGHGRACTEAA